MTALIILGLVLLALLGVPLFIVLAAGALLLAASSGIDSAVLIIEMARLGSSPHAVGHPIVYLCGRGALARRRTAANGANFYCAGGTDAWRAGAGNANVLRGIYCIFRGIWRPWVLRSSGAGPTWR